MLELGKKQILTVVKTVDFGVYLGESTQAGEQERVLLPKKQVKEGTKPGDSVEVFLYKDSRDRLIATTRTPLVMLGETALLEVKETGRIGAFLDWGLEKDLLLPFHEQTKRVQKGEKCLVALYVDKSKRLCATMKVYPYLRTDSAFAANDMVKGIVYDISDNFGVFAAVEGKYSGLVPKQEAQGHFKIGEERWFRISSVKEDGKLNLSVKQKAYLQMSEDAREILRVIEEYAGVLPFDDKVSPEVIQREFGMSKAAFKRAVGNLLKEKKIELKNGRIFLLQ